MYEAKNIKICNFWTFWPITVRNITWMSDQWYYNIVIDQNILTLFLIVFLILLKALRDWNDSQIYGLEVTEKGSGTLSIQKFPRQRHILGM